MRRIRYGVVALGMLLCFSATSAPAQVSVGIGIGVPNLTIGINLPLFPELVPVPGYPVYYAPGLDYNYFFYDGMYWVFLDDNWYCSYWYNGPWALVGPEVVPVYILRVPVRYYRHPPHYFRGWRADRPPRWGQHWGRDWERHRRGWDKWDRRSAPKPAPLPSYQRQYTGDRYPRQVDQQRMLHREQYRYQPRDRAIRQHFEQHRDERGRAPEQRGRQDEQRMRGPGPQEMQHQAPRQSGGPAGPQAQPPQQSPLQERGPAVRERREPPGTMQREQQAPRQQEPARGHGEGPGREGERGRDR